MKAAAAHKNTSKTAQSAAAPCRSTSTSTKTAKLQPASSVMMIERETGRRLPETNSANHLGVVPVLRPSRGRTRRRGGNAQPLPERGKTRGCAVCSSTSTTADSPQLRVCLRHLRSTRATFGSGVDEAQTRGQAGEGWGLCWPASADIGGRAAIRRCYPHWRRSHQRRRARWVAQAVALSSPDYGRSAP